MHLLNRLAKLFWRQDLGSAGQYFEIGQSQFRKVYVYFQILIGIERVKRR